MGHVTRNMFSYLNFFCLLYYILQYTIVLFLLHFVENRTVPYRSDPFQIDIAYWIKTERFTELNNTERLKKSGVDNRF